MIIPKWLAATVVAVVAILAVALWRQTPPAHRLRLASGPVAAAPAEAPAATEEPLVAPVSDVTPQDREAKRFHRYDKNKDGVIDRDEYLAARKKAFAKLDTNHDGKLSFEEYSVKAIAKFDAADAHHDGKLTPEEFATTAVKRKPRTKAICPPGTAAPAAHDQGEREEQ